MKCMMKKPVSVSLSKCGSTGKMTVPHIFSLFMDLAAEHGDAIGLGMDALSQKGLFWLTVKTKVRIFRLPSLLESLTAVTWPEVPGRIRCDRSYELRDANDAVVAAGRTEWAMLEVDTGRLARIADSYPPDMEHCAGSACDGPYARISDDFAQCLEIGRYTVRSTDIDLGQHMNNAAYIHAIFGAFSCRELETLSVREADVLFRTPCYEGDTLSIRRREIPDGMELGVLREDGTTAVAARILL
ncbi:MAG: hypothetical protein IKV57_02390 [Clostridia bacterium]|nr:hypothetical protein [Clostridia bacterium]